MLMAIIQAMLGSQEFNPIDYLLENIAKNKTLVKEMKNSPYYNIAERISKVGILEALDDISKIHLGHFEMIKNTLISYFRE
jgi:hypothetical protein